MVSLVLVLLAFLSLGLASSSASKTHFIEREKLSLGKFHDFIETFGKTYHTNAEFQTRYNIFKENLATADRLNNEEKGTAEYGVTIFSDLTDEEFERKFTGLKISPEDLRQRSLASTQIPDEEIIYLDDHEFARIQELKDQKDGVKKVQVDNEDDEHVKVIGNRVYLPKHIDYRRRKCVNPAKSQGECGSCWAFSAIANIEGVWAKKHKRLLDLSEQELLDCDKLDKACQGGWPSQAIKELARIGGVMNSTTYPYVGHSDGTCRFDAKNAVVKVLGNLDIPSNEDQMAKQLAKTGPVSIAVVANSYFKLYRRGIMVPSPSQCSHEKTSVNHAVTLVGYSQTRVNHKPLPYWIIKNSWSSHWGEKGFMRIKKGINACALTSFPVTAVI